MSDNTKPLSSAKSRIVTAKISSLLEPEGQTIGVPKQLLENAGIAYQGCILLGMGFVLQEAEALRWIQEEPAYRDVLFPYLTGEDANSRPDVSASRWAIDFNDRSESDAAIYRKPFERIKETVYHERQTNKRKSYSDYWWRYAENRPAMRRALSALSAVPAITLTSKIAMPVRISTAQVISNKLAVFATDSFALQAVLSSSVHWLWAVKYSTTMKTDINYTPRDAFETFPRPQDSRLLEQNGEALERKRGEIMVRRNLGLTKLYNLVNDPLIAGASDPDVARMRDMHVELDGAVMDAYGWSDIPLDHGFHTYRQMHRWTVSPAARVEILDRLLEENQRRAAEEAKQTPQAKSKGRRGKSAPDEQGTLL